VCLCVCVRIYIFVGVCVCVCVTVIFQDLCGELLLSNVSMISYRYLDTNFTQLCGAGSVLIYFCTSVASCS